METAMDLRLQLPTSDAWQHAAGIINAAPDAWSAALAACASALEADARAAAPPATTHATDDGILTSAAYFVLPRVVAWAPGRNGTDAATELGPALEASGLTSEAAEAVSRVFATRGKSLVHSARVASAAMLASSGAADSAAFLEYTGSVVRVSRGTVQAEDAHVRVHNGLHEPVACVSLPRDAQGAQALLSLSAADAYTLFGQVDDIQRAIDALFDARAEAHSDPAA
jgi:hypothetical protein